jgi:hypothetical protein
MPEPTLEAFIRLTVDDALIKAKMGALRGEALKWGEQVGQAFQEGTAKGGETWRRRFGTGVPTTGFGPVRQTVATFQGRFGEFVRRQREGMAGGPGGIMGGLGGAGAGPGGRGGFGGIGVLGRAAGLAGAGRLGGLARLAGADPRAALAVGATLAVTNYVNQIKQAAEAERELNRALKERDPEAVNAILVKRVSALKDLEDAAREAYQPVTSLETAVRAALGQFALSWEQLTGPGMANRRKQVEEATKAATEMWEAFGAPKLAIDAQKRAAAETQALGAAQLKAAEDTMSHFAAIGLLIKAKEDDAKASKDLIDLEIERIRLDKSKPDPQKEKEIEDARGRKRAIDKKFVQDRKEIWREERQQLGEMEAAEIEHTAKMTSLAQERRDVIVETLGSIVETEAATNLSLQEAFRARAAIMAEGTKNALDRLKEETAARRQSLEARLGGATGQERVRIERELTQLTQEEETRRTKIVGDAVADRLRLLRQAQQEQIAIQERVFAIQRMLGERSLHDDLQRQTAIAQGARAGSQTQLKALEQVASLTKGLSDQAKDFLNTALAASDELARKQGRAPGPVSMTGLGGLAQTAATRFAQLTAAERTFQTGGEIAPEDVRAIFGGELDKLRQQREAGLKTLAQNVGRFGGGIPGGDLTQVAFGEQIARAFEKPIDTFTSQVGPQFASMVSKAAPQFDEMTDLWSQAVDKMVKKAEDGSSKMGAALYETFKTRLARDLDREVKTF